MPSAVLEPRVLLDGLAYVESPRWHEGDSGSAVAAPARSSRSTSTATVKSWAPVRPRSTPRSQAMVSAAQSTGFPKELLRIAPDGSMVPHADLVRLADFWNEIVVDARGNVYVNSIAFQFIAGAEPNSGIIALVTQDGSARRVAGGLGPDGICIDQEGTVWAQTSRLGEHRHALWPLVLSLIPPGFGSGLLVPTLTSEAISVVGPASTASRRSDRSSEPPDRSATDSPYACSSPAAATASGLLLATRHRLQHPRACANGTLNRNAHPTPSPDPHTPSSTHPLLAAEKTNSRVLLRTPTIS